MDKNKYKSTNEEKYEKEKERKSSEVLPCPCLAIILSEPFLPVAPVAPANTANLSSGEPFIIFYANSVYFREFSVF